jgi:hypothetical protein
MIAASVSGRMDVAADSADHASMRAGTGHREFPTAVTAGGVVTATKM